MEAVLLEYFLADADDAILNVVEWDIVEKPGNQV